MAGFAHIASRFAPVRRRNVSTLLLFLLASALFFPRFSRAAERTKAETITSAAAIRQLSIKAAAEGRPVHISGVVTFVDWGWHTLFIQDHSAGIYVFLARSKVIGDLRPGKSVTLDGVTTPGDFCPAITNARIVVGPDVAPPEPKRPSMDAAMTGALDSQWVELQGIVRSAQLIRKHFIVTVHHLGHSFTLTFTDFPPSRRNTLVGSEIIARGALSTKFNEKRQLVGINLNVPSPAFLTVVQQAAANPFDAPEKPLGSVGQFSDDAESSRVRVSATVTAVDPNGTLYVSDGRDRIAVRPLNRSCNVKPGEAITILGFPAPQDSRPTLEDAVCREEGSPVLISPLRVLPNQTFINNEDQPASATKNDMKLVTIEATLIQTLYGVRNETLLLNGGGHVFGATLPSHHPELVASLEPGSLLRLTGVCLMSYDALQQGESFRLLLRSHADVVVVARPSWWNVRHILWIVCFCITVIFAGLLWIFVRRKREFARQLLKEKDLAETANRLKGEFLANMSHEIRTPMNAVLGMTSLALSVDINDEVREYLRMAQDAANQLLTLLNDVLDYSKIEAHKLVLEKIEFSPRDVVRKAARMLAVKAHEKDLELLYFVEPDVPQVIMGDSYRLQQLLVNLIGNAIKFTETGEVSVSVSGRHGSGSDYRLCFVIRDTGIGIDVVSQATVFEPFTQADGSTTRKHGGTGLGLSICKQLVSLMGGQISVTSMPGEGSTFTFDCLFEHAPAADSPTGSSTSAITLHGKRILILTNNRTAVSILERYIARWGMRSISAITMEGAETELSSALAAGIPFDAILADREFAGRDGFEVLQGLRTLSKTPVPAVMMLSSVLIGSDLSRCRQLRATGYVLKPVDPNELLAGLLQVLEPAPCAIKTSVDGSPRKDLDPSLTILLAEDNAINRKLASTLLRKAGHEVVTVENGRDAVTELEKRDFDVVLMDVQMPVMDGFEAASCIRNLKNKQKAGVPIIALTAHALQGYRERCLQAGMNDYLTKPIDTAALMKMLNEIAARVLL